MKNKIVSPAEAIAIIRSGDTVSVAGFVGIGTPVGTAEYSELALPGGHVGVFVGGKSQKLFAPGVFAFLQKHDRTVS